MKKFFSFVAAVLFAGSMMATDLLNTDFTQGQGDWTIDNVTLPEGSEFVWAAAGNYGMKATAYFESANHESESWLVSPVIDMSAVEAATLAFSHARRYGDLSQLSVKASTDGEVWSDLTISAWPDGSSWSFIDATADMSNYAGEATVQIAFVYTSSATAAATWEIKTVVVSDGDAPEPPVDDADVTFSPADFEGQGQAATLETPGGEVSATKNGVTVAADNAYGHNLALRVYQGAHFTITSSDKAIKTIKFQFYSTYTGGLQEEYTVNAQSWDIAAMEKQARIEKIQIYFDAEEGIENVVLTEKAKKVVVDGMVFIVRDGKMFDLTGAQVR